MIHTVDNFFNKAAEDIKATYFKEVSFYRDSEQCAAATYALELFSNGCINYRKLIGRLSKACKDTTENIHALVEKYIVSFGNYQYSPKKQKP